MYLVGSLSRVFSQTGCGQGLDLWTSGLTFWIRGLGALVVWVQILYYATPDCSKQANNACTTRVYFQMYSPVLFPPLDPLEQHLVSTETVTCQACGRCQRFCTGEASCADCSLNITDTQTHTRSFPQWKQSQMICFVLDELTLVHAGEDCAHPTLRNKAGICLNRCQRSAT